MPSSSVATLPRPSEPARGGIGGSAIWKASGAEVETITGTETPTMVRRVRQAVAVSPPSKVRFGLPVKISLFLALLLVPLAAITWTVSVQALRARMTEEFSARGTAIATSLANSGLDLILTRDASTVQSLVDEFAAISGVAYVMVYDPQKAMIAHTFAPSVPEGIIDKNPVPGEARNQVRETQYRDPGSRETRDVIDIGVPMLGGAVGTVRVGMNKAIIEAAATRTGNQLLMVFGAAAGVALLAGVFFARRITRPVARLVRVSERVGQGDLSQVVPVTSRDEIGQLAETFNQTIVRLRGQVQTEAERDDERKKRQELQQHITTFLDTATEIAQGDLTRRGEVTSDVLGNVVDAINVMVDEIGTVVGDVRQAAVRVTKSSQEMIVSTGHMATGAQAQTREAVAVAKAVAELTQSVKQVAGIAEASAAAARQALEASQKGDDAVRNSLEGMQRIRGEVQTISKKIKGLGDRSLEISEIVNTIEDIASQTNLLAVNAAIEAAGAGEAGLRFAVVADEIRKLAERSAKATKDIAALITGVQTDTHEAIVVMEQGTNEVESGYRVTVQAGQSLKEIDRISQKSAELAREISQATQQQVRGAEGVAAAVQSIAGVAAQTEQGVLETRKTVDQLVKLAEELTASLARFKLAA
jgi:methyl-accepting chemotaxis protein